MSSPYPGVVNYEPDYASYNWTGPPSDFSNLATNAVGGDSSEILHNNAQAITDI
jgi:hypothetical protein